MDTAGLRETENAVEKIGVERSLEAVGGAELVLYVVDGAAVDGTATDGVAATEVNGGAWENVIGVKPCIIVINKCDLPGVAESTSKKNFLPQEITENAERQGLFPQFVTISAKTGLGLDKLFAAISAAVFSGMGTAPMEGADFSQIDIITRERHRLLLAEAIGHLEQAVADFDAGVAEDIVAIGLRGAYLSLGHILGEEFSDDIIDRIFAEFCVGK
jgi:tRNA modification GTPase